VKIDTQNTSQRIGLKMSYGSAVIIKEEVVTTRRKVEQTSHEQYGFEKKVSIQDIKVGQPFRFAHSGWEFGMVIRHQTSGEKYIMLEDGHFYSDNVPFSDRRDKVIPLDFPRTEDGKLIYVEAK
jgi:hypothetical protein